MVCNIDKNSISFPDIDSWPRKPPVYCDNGFCMAQSAHILHLYLSKHKGLIHMYMVENQIFLILFIFICCLEGYECKWSYALEQLLTSNWYFFMAASAGEVNEPRNNPNKTKAPNPQKILFQLLVLAIFSIWLWTTSTVMCLCDDASQRCQIFI